MKTIRINNERRIMKPSISLGFVEENKVETIQFKIPEEYEKYNKKACFKGGGEEFSLLINDDDTLEITNAITKFKKVDMAIEFFDEDIVARTSKIRINFEDTITGGDLVGLEPQVIILDDLIEKVNNLDIDLNDNLLVITRKDGNIKSTNVKGDKGDPGRFQIHIVDSLPTTGEDGVMYLVKKENATEEDLYNEYVYADGKWNLIGNTHIDLSDYYKKSETYSRDEVDDLISDKQAGVELYGTYEDNVLNIGLNDENGTTLSNVDIEIPQYQEIHYTWDKTTGDDAKELFQMVYSYYKRGVLLNVDLQDGNKMYKLVSISQPNSMGSEYWCQFRTLDWYTNNVDMVFLQTINAVLTVAGNIVQSIEVKESINQFALVREYNGNKGALPVDNTIEFVPQNEYEPATKRYVDLTHYQRISGYTTNKTQVLKNINGTLIWFLE